MGRYKLHNIYTRVSGTTETVIIDEHTVTDHNYGTRPDKLNITNLIIANSSDSNAAEIDLYLKHEEENVPTFIRNELGQREIQPVTTVTGTKENGDVVITKTAWPYTDHAELPLTTTTYYLLRATQLPVGTTLIIDKEMFKDIRFDYYKLCAVGRPSTSVDIIVNFK